MKHFVWASLIATLPLSSAVAQDGEPDMDAETDGYSLMEKGARLFFDGIMSEMEPALSDLQDLAEKMGPAFRQFAVNLGPALMALLEKVDDVANYELPEFLPNGDIILRRKPDAPDWTPPVAPPIDL